MSDNNDPHGQRYSEEKKRQILKYLETHTYKETVSHFDISEPTLARWRQAQSQSGNDATKTKIIITFPQFWLDYLNERIKEGDWENYDQAFLSLLKKYESDRKAHTLEAMDATGDTMLKRLNFDEFFEKNPEFEAIIIKTKDQIKYQSAKWPSPEIEPLMHWVGGRRSVRFNGTKYLVTRSDEEHILYSKARLQSEINQTGDSTPSTTPCNSENFICGLRIDIQDQRFYFFALVNGKPPCHVMTANMNFERFIKNLKPISEADIIKPYTDREQVKRKAKVSSGQKNGNSTKTDDLDEILEEREQVPLQDMEKLVIEKLEAKIGQSIPFNEYASKMPDICYYAVHGHLTKLRIRNVNLTCIPDLIKELTFLEVLDLQNNHLTTLPDSVGNLGQLEELNLSYNELQNLPDIFGRMNKLSLLYLGNNKFNEFPMAICKLRNLQELEIANNQIINLPVKVRLMDKLRSVDIRHNLLQSIDPDYLNLGGPVISWKNDEIKAHKKKEEKA